MAERIEEYSEDHIDECAHLFMTAFNAEPWNDSYTQDTATDRFLASKTSPASRSAMALFNLSATSLRVRPYT